MIALIAHYLISLVAAFFIGLATAWLAWGRRPPAAVEDPDLDEPILWPERAPPPPADPRAEVMATAPEPPAQEEVPEAQTIAGMPEQDEAEPATPEPAAVEAASPSMAQPQPAAEPSAQAFAANPEVEDAERDAAGAPDDLTLIKGIGPQIDTILRSLGIVRFDQIAGWMPEDIERIGEHLGDLKGRIIRDEWIAQARLLARGELETFVQRYGHL